MTKTHEVVAEEHSTSSMASENSVDSRASLEVMANSIGGQENDPRRERDQDGVQRAGQRHILCVVVCQWQ